MNICPICKLSFKKLDFWHLSQHTVDEYKKTKKEYSNSITVTHPNLAQEWDSTKNNTLPAQFTKGSNKKIWWLCDKKHSWKSTIKSRTRYRNKKTCPECNCLSVLYPDISDEWHPTKNKSTPNKFSAGSSKKIWWLCKKGHSYKASIKHRTKSKSGCPYCAGKLACKDNSLLLFPELVKEWHPTKNKKSPSSYTSGSKKKVWWLCSNDHTWNAVIHHRTGKAKSGCPLCYTPKFSKIEKIIAFELNNFVIVEHEKVRIDTKEGKKSVDIFISDLGLIIEFDGAYYHQNKLEADMKKTSLLFNESKTVMRLRCYPLEKITAYDVIIPKKKDANVKYCVIAVLKQIEKIYNFEFPTLEEYIKRAGLLSANKANNYILSQLNRRAKRSSIA